VSGSPADGRVRLSLNEVEVCLKKAALGAGLPLGYAEDLAGAVAWLCRWGFPGIPAGLESLEAARDGTTALARPSDDGETLASADGRPAAAWHAGPTLADLLRGEPDTLELHVPSAEWPLLVLGALGVYSEAKGPGLSLRWDGGAALCRNGVPYLIDGAWASLERRREGAVSAGAADPRSRGTRRTASGAPEADGVKADVFEIGVRVEAEIWARLQALVRLTLVPASEASRSAGAGAGLRDTD
jgi:hypothetical protein